MHSTNSHTVNDPTISERLRRYRPSSLSATQLSRFLASMREVVLAAGPRHYEEARNWLSVLAAFVGETATPAARTLAEIFTDAAVSRWVGQSAQEGRSRHTLKTRRGTLARLLAAQRGAQTSERRATTSRRQASPITTAQLEALFACCNQDSLSARRGALAHLLAGVPVGTRRARFEGDSSSLAVVTASQRYFIPPSMIDMAGVGECYLNEEDWVALKDLATELGLLLTPSVALRMSRQAALSDTSLTLAQRIERYGVSEDGCSAVLGVAIELSDDEFLTGSSILRDGSASGVCTNAAAAAPSGSPRPRGTKEAGQQMARKTSRAAAQRLAAQRMAEAATRAQTAQPVADYLATYVPDECDEIWTQIAGSVRRAIEDCQFQTVETARKYAVALNAYLRWRAQHGQSTDITTALTFAPIDEFFARGLCDLSDRSRRDYRSRLRTLAQRANASVGAPPALRLGHNQVNAGYSLAEERLIRRAALNQYKPRARQRLCAIVGFCAGAGLSSEELRELRRRDCTIHDDGTIEVRVPGKRPRRTVVRRIYERHVLIALQGLNGDDLVLTALKCASPITAILKDADLYGNLPAIDTRRLRTTWIEWLMDQRVPLALAVEASGLRSSRTFWDILSRRSASFTFGELREGGTK